MLVGDPALEYSEQTLLLWRLSLADQGEGWAGPPPSLTEQPRSGFGRGGLGWRALGGSCGMAMGKPSAWGLGERIWVEGTSLGGTCWEVAITVVICLMLATQLQIFLWGGLPSQNSYYVHWALIFPVELRKHNFLYFLDILCRQHLHR